MWFLWVLGIVVGILVDVYIASVFLGIACEKGYVNEKKYFWITFFFGIVGMLMVVALPDRAGMNKIIGVLQEQKKEVDTKEESSEPDSSEAIKRFSGAQEVKHKWLCSACGKLRDESPCPFCGNE